MNHERAIALLQGQADPLPPEEAAEWNDLADYLEVHPDLDDWFRHHTPVDAVLRTAFTSIAAPEVGDLLASVHETSATRPPQMPAAPRRQFLRLAASLAIGAGAAWWLMDRRRAGPAEYAATPTVEDFRRDLAEFSAGFYKLDVKGVSLDDATMHLAHAGAATPCGLPASIRSMAFIGCKVIEWRGRKVGMTCFDCGKRDVVHVFTVALDAFREVPPAEELSKPVVCCERETAGWINDGRLHLAIAAKPGHHIADLVS